MALPYCLICEQEITDVAKHICDVHFKEPEVKNNKGTIKCRLCKVKVGDMRRHIHSKLHRHHILKDAVWPTYTAEDYIRHYDKVLNRTREEVDNDSNHPFWTAARESLGKEEYKRLENHVYGRVKGKRRSIRCRNTKPRRPGIRTRRNGKDNN